MKEGGTARAVTKEKKKAKSQGYVVSSPLQEKKIHTLSSDAALKTPGCCQTQRDLSRVYLKSCDKGF